MKIKRKALSILSCFALLVSSIPSTAIFVSAEAYIPATEPVFEKVGTSETPCVFANGTPITVKTEGDKVVVEYSFEGQTKKLDTQEDIPANVTIFGGSHNKEGTLQSSEVIIDGVKVHGVFGGGLHKSHVETATVTVKGTADINFVQGGGASSFKGLEDDCEWYSGNTENAITRVDEATVKIEGDGCDIGTVFGGGEGISSTGNTEIKINGGNIAFVGAGGSNGYTGSATVNINGGNIDKVQSVNRGTMDSAEFNVSGGTIEKFYIGGEKEDSTVTGTITKATVNITGGKVNNMYPGTSGGPSSPVDTNNTQNFSVEVSSKAEVGLDETLQESKILECKHNLVLQPGTPAECETAGTEDSWKCKNCQKLFADENAAKEIQQAETIDALGHEYSEPIKVFGCDDKVNAKLTYAICLRCEKYFDASSGVEEQYTELTAAQDKNDDGVFDQKDIAKYGEHPEASIEELEGKDATCTTEGKSTGYRCKDCGDMIVPQVNTLIDEDNHVDANGEDAWGEWKAIDENSDKSGIYEPVTCTKDGWEYRKCKQCGEEEYREAKAKDHSFPEEKPENGKDNPDYKEATCTEGGTYRLKCSVCGELSDIKNSDPLGHDMERVAAKAPTCTEAGNVYNWHCKRCDLHFEDQAGKTPIEDVTIPATNHKNTQSYEAIAHTCRESGRKAYVLCKDCNKVISIDGVALETPAEFDEVKYQIIIARDPNAHQWGDYKPNNDATCTTPGTKTAECSVCGATDTKEDTDNPAIGHDWDWTLQVTKEPTCIAGGEGEITCKRCDEKEIVIIDKNPSAHKYKNDGICQLCGQKDPGYVVVTQSGSNVTTSKDTSKNNKKNAKIVKIINSRNKTKVKIKKKKIIIKFSRRGGCKYRIKIYNKKNKEISLKVKQDYMKGNGKKKFKKFYQIKKKGDYRIEIYELKGMKEKNFKDVKCIYLNYKTIK